MPEEVWKRHPNFPIEVSTLGSIRSVAYLDGWGRWRKPIPRKPFLDSAGYPVLSLFRKVRKVHRLVLETFVGPCPPDMETLHLDANRANPALSNLRYGTRAENARQCVADGNNTFASRYGQRTHCPQGHPLVAPNLVSSPRGYRRCKACKQANTWKRDNPWEQGSVQVVSDRYFSRMGIPRD